MISMRLDLEGDGAWPELRLMKVNVGTSMAVTAIRDGMQSGKPSVAFKIETGPDEVTFVETSLALFLAAADALKARYGDPRSD